MIEMVQSYAVADLALLFKKNRVYFYSCLFYNCCLLKENVLRYTKWATFMESATILVILLIYYTLSEKKKKKSTEAVTGTVPFQMF